MTNTNTLNSTLIKDIIETEINGLQSLLQICQNTLEHAIHLIANCAGHVVITGVGKSGNIASKIVASMSSLGIPSFFLEPSNAGHGDIGSITKGSILIAISNSGESHEIMAVINFCHERNIPTIAITRNEKSTIAQNATVAINLPPMREAHPFNAPTTSTTQTLVIGDVLTICASHLKGFQKEDYAKLHPSGNLGMHIAKVKTIMNHELELVKPNEEIHSILMKMTNHSNGFVCVVENQRLVGIITDGDIRRYLLTGKDIKNVTANDISNPSPKYVSQEDYIIQATNVLSQYSIQSVLVVNSSLYPVGFVARKQFNMN